MAERHEGNFSSFVSKTLDNNGYSWQAICRRRNLRKQQERFSNRYAVGTGFCQIHAGSIREGVGKQFGSDYDTMLVVDQVICREDFLDFDRRDLTFFEIDFHGCPPGYAHLTLVKHGIRISMDRYTNESANKIERIIKNSCCDSESGKLYINSDMFMKIFDERTQLVTVGHRTAANVRKRRAGPSSPCTVGNLTGKPFGKYDIDCVPSFTCHCPSLFEKFRNRPRRHDWPSPDLLQELSQLDAHAVAVGDKLSEDHFMQWRICFTQAEIRLIERLTEPQIHVFVLLKIFSKDVLKKIWDKMTSYVVKNVMLWMAELTPTNKFQTDTIVERFTDCLFFLKLCVKAGFLPNYMISERNLFRHEQFIVKRKQLLSVLEDCLYEKGSCLLKSETLKEALLEMYTRPEVALQHGIDQETILHSVSSCAEGMLSGGMLEALLSPSITLQDKIRLVAHDVIRFGSNTIPEVRKLIQGHVSDEEIQRDPAAALQKLLQRTISYMK